MTNINQWHVMMLYHSLVIWRGLVLAVDEKHLLDGIVPHLLELLPLAIFPRVQPLTIRGVDGLRRGRPENITILGTGNIASELSCLVIEQ